MKAPASFTAAFLASASFVAAARTQAQRKLTKATMASRNCGSIEPRAATRP